jgi:hypothetical protein
LINFGEKYPLDDFGDAFRFDMFDKSWVASYAEETTYSYENLRVWFYFCGWGNSSKLCYDVYNNSKTQKVLQTI